MGCGCQGNQNQPQSYGQFATQNPTSNDLVALLKKYAVPLLVVGGALAAGVYFFGKKK